MKSVERVEQQLFALGDVLRACAERNLGESVSGAIKKRILKIGKEARRYPGEYVAIGRDAVLAHGTNRGAVLREAKKKEKKPMIVRVPRR